MSKDDEIMNAEMTFNSATGDIRKALGGKTGFSTEAKYGDAYQHLVRLGIKPQIRRKYRG
jgi:hypothetical protein